MNTDEIRFLTSDTEAGRDAAYEADAFLTCWMQGDLEEWPEYYEWLEKHGEEKK